MPTVNFRLKKIVTTFIKLNKSLSLETDVNLVLFKCILYLIGLTL